MGLFDRLKGKKSEAPVAVAPAGPTPEQRQLAEIRDAVLILHWAALGDGVQQEEEYEVIRQYVRERIAAVGPKNADIEAIIAWVKPERPTQEIIREAIGRVVSSIEHGQMVRRYAQTLIKSDDNVDVGEMEAMRLISKFFAEAEALRR